MTTPATAITTPLALGDEDLLPGHLLQMAPAAATNTVVVLSEDLLREVFIRLPTAEDLVRAAAACKPFLHAARNPAFLRRFRRLHPTTCSRLIGCLINSDGRRHVNPRFIPSSPSSPKNTLWAFRLFLLPGDDWFDEYRKRWQHLDCRNGRILRKTWSGELRVVDPLSRSYVDLPAAPTSRRAIGWGLVVDDGDSSVFRVVCISRDTPTSLDLRAHTISSGDLSSWVEAANSVACQPNLVGFRAMQANQSLYWKLEGGERMVAFSTVTMELSLLDLPSPSLRQGQLSFDIIEKGDEEEEEDHRRVIHLLTIRGLRIETWAGTPDGDGGGTTMAWMLMDRSKSFQKSLFSPYDYDYARSEQIELDVVGVVAGVVFVRRSSGNLFSVDLQTMNVKVLSKDDAWQVGIYPYTITWPPSFLNSAPAGQGASEIGTTSHC